MASTGITHIRFPGVSVWLWWGCPTLEYYCGLSGILNSLLAVGLAQVWRATHHPLVWFTGLCAATKVVIEINSGRSLLTDTTWASVPEAHAIGLVSGLAAIGIHWAALQSPARRSTGL